MNTSRLSHFLILAYDLTIEVYPHLTTSNGYHGSIVITHINTCIYIIIYASNYAAAYLHKSGNYVHNYHSCVGRRDIITMLYYIISPEVYIIYIYTQHIRELVNNVYTTIINIILIIFYGVILNIIILDHKL